MTRELARVARRSAGALVAGVLMLAGCTDPTFTSPAGDAESSGSDGAAENEEYDSPTRGAALGAPDSSSAPATDASTDSARLAGNESLDGAGPANPSTRSTDAGARYDPSFDAGSDAALAYATPAWAEPLLGRYFKRSVTFGYDDAAREPLNTRNVEYSLLTVEQGDGGLEFRIQLCAVSSTWVAPPPTTNSRFLLPGSLPSLRGRLLLEAPDRFSSDTVAQQLGFDPAQGCDTTGRMVKRPGQTWITGATCLCSLAPLPTEIDDCRIVDSDRDGKPGVGVLGEIPPLPVAAGLMVFDYTLTFKDGKIAADRRHTLVEERTQGAGCLTGAITDVCYIGNNQLCPGGSTKLVPAEPNATCAELDASAFGELAQRPSTTDCRTPSR